MIINQEIYDQAKSVWTEINCKCDYCDITFIRSKRNIKVGRTIIQKDSCNSKECVKKKRIESQQLKYGVDNAGGTKESLDKAKATWMQNLGVENPMYLQSIKDEMAKTCQERYGKTSYLGTKKCRNELKEYCLNNHGVENPGQVELFKEKIKSTCQKKYGVDHPRKYKKFMDEFVKLFFEKHGVNYPAQMKDHLEKREKTCLVKYGFRHPVQNIEIQEKIRQTCLELYGKYPVNCFGKTEFEIKEFIEKLGFTCNSDRKLLEGKEVDIYIPEKKIGIEYCGLYWHNEMSPCPRDKNFHFDKYKTLQSKEIKLITIFEDEWLEKQNICKSIISSKLGVFINRIFARKCIVKQIDVNYAKNFLDQNHLQGAGKIQNACGLYFEDKLIACASYGRHHRQNQNCVVINRFCSSINTQIVGGISKLFSFIKKEISSKIITWSDNRWSDGEIYKALGFKLEETLGPDYSYYKNGSVGKRKSKQSMKKSNTNCPKDKTEREWCLENGYVRIWDCGKKRWGYE